MRDGPFIPDRLAGPFDAVHAVDRGRSTLHLRRHYFASEVVQLTKDILLVRDLLGHASVATMQIYMPSSIDGAQVRLGAFSGCWVPASGR